MGLRPRNLTTSQSCYASVYELGNILVPSQDYKRQGLVKAQQYTVLAQDRSTNQLTLETPMGQILTINPAQCRKTTVYEMQSIPIAVGDWLRWTKNDRNAGIRNGQTFTVDRIAPDGIAQITNSDGKTIEVNLSGRQYLDYAWVSTIYSSQGKTADRVLALVDGITTNRESFYVTISRTKHHLSLYTTDKVALAELAQKSKVKENVSDYIPLFQVVPNHAQTSQTPSQFAPASDQYRDFAKRIGERVGERICQNLQPIAQELIALRQQVTQLEQQTQQMHQTLQPLPQHLSSMLSHFLTQLQASLNSETSSSARETLHKQLQQLIAALSTWSNQLKTELTLQQQLIDSMQQLEQKLDNFSSSGNLAQSSSSNLLNQSQQLFSDQMSAKRLLVPNPFHHTNL